MPLRRTPAAPPAPPVIISPAPAAPRGMQALVAAAAQIKLDEGSVIRATINDQDWQRESWRHLDICGELRFAANRHASAISQCRLFVAELDDRGAPGEETKDPKLQVLAETLFGGPAAKAEAMRTIGIDFYVGGECFIVAEGATNPRSDVWYIVTANQIKRTGSQYFVKRPQTLGGGTAKLTAGKDLLIRAWTPHPRNNDLADSPTRSVLPVLREIERLTQLMFSQIDSRLISAGMLLFPQGTSFPKADGTPGDLNDLMAMILEVARAQLTGAGTAAGVVPILAEIPTDSTQKPEHLTFDTPLQNELREKLDQAIKRLAVGLDIAPEEMLGLGKSNHWSAWSIDETGIKLFIQPVMSRICDALTQGYLLPAMQAMGIENPEQYTLWYDTSAITVRPNRFEDAIKLHEIQVIDDEALRKAGNFSDETAPSKQELAVQRAWEIVKLKPEFLQQKEYADLLGLPVASPPPAPALPGGQQGFDANPDTPPGGDQGARDSAIEQQLGLPQTPSGGPPPAAKGRQALTASAALLPAAEQAVLRALELAGGRMLDRKARGRYADIPRHELHTRISVSDRDHARRLLSGAFSHAGQMAAHFEAVSGADLERLLESYCVELLVRGFAHESDYLQLTLTAAVPSG